MVQLLTEMPLPSMITRFLTFPDDFQNRSRKHFSGLAILLDNGSPSDGPLDQALASLDTLHSVTPDEILLVLPGQPDDSAPGTWWSSLSPELVGAPTLRDELRDIEVDTSQEVSEPPEANASSRIVPDYQDRTRSIIDFMGAGSRTKQKTRASAIVGTNPLLDWLGVDHSILPSVLILSVPDTMAIFVEGRLAIVSIFDGMRKAMQEEKHTPASAVLARGSKNGMEKVGSLVLTPAILTRWEAQRVRPRATPAPNTTTRKGQ